MVKILLYGGCHALVLRDLLERFFDASTVKTSLLINFKLIGSGEPFPYERLGEYDAVVFSPIENKGDYNTDRLRDQCETSRTKAICFPWMEWHGYCPGAVKGVFKGRFQWFYPELLEIAARFDTFDRFVEHVIEHFPHDALIDHTVARTTAMLAAAEARHDMPVRIKDFIEARHRSSRLFLISDHPALALYWHVLAQITGLLGLQLPATGLAALSDVEPQWRWRTPIFPRVAERLGLDFQDTDWLDDELVPARTWPLETYLSLYFHRDSVILGPIETSGLYLGAEPLAHATQLDLGSRILASSLRSEQSAGLDTYAYLETLAGRSISLDPGTAFKIDSKQWRSTWDF